MLVEILGRYPLDLGYDLRRRQAGYTQVPQGWISKPNRIVGT